MKRDRSKYLYSSFHAHIPHRDQPHVNGHIGEREPVYLYYPFSLSKYSFNDRLVPFVILFFGMIVVLGNIVETYMYVNNEERKTVEGWGFKEVVDDYRGKMVDMKEGFLRRVKRE